MTLTLAGSHANVTYIHEAMSLTTSARLPLVHLPGAAIFSSCANIPDALGRFCSALVFVFFFCRPAHWQSRSFGQKFAVKRARGRTVSNWGGVKLRGDTNSGIYICMFCYICTCIVSRFCCLASFCENYTPLCGY